MMGTSSAYGGPGNNTPLVPTWLEPDSPVLPIAPPGVPLVATVKVMMGQVLQILYCPTNR
ncbi:MAG: hypothetical protein HS126_37520 [Anaerolineales bacterium]|nr:hypothetical protein [Anaerolineales bacterium]